MFTLPFQNIRPLSLPSLPSCAQSHSQNSLCHCSVADTRSIGMTDWFSPPLRVNGIQRTKAYFLPTASSPTVSIICPTRGSQAASLPFPLEKVTIFITTRRTVHQTPVMKWIIHQAFIQLIHFILSHPFYHTIRSTEEPYFTERETKAQRNEGIERCSKLTNREPHCQDPNPGPLDSNHGWPHLLLLTTGRANDRNCPICVQGTGRYCDPKPEVEVSGEYIPTQVEKDTERAGKWILGPTGPLTVMRLQRPLQMGICSPPHRSVPGFTGQGETSEVSWEPQLMRKPCEHTRNNYSQVWGQTRG